MGDSEQSGTFEELGIPTAQDFTYQYVEMKIAENVAWLTMNRPPYNVLTADMMLEMARAIGELHDERSVRVIVLQAAPECTAFSAGVAVEDSRPERAFQTLEAMQAVFNNFIETSKPVVTVVNGPAIGGGCELAERTRGNHLRQLDTSLPLAEIPRESRHQDVFEDPPQRLCTIRALGARNTASSVESVDALGFRASTRFAGFSRDSVG